MNTEKIRKTVEKLLDINDPSELEAAAGLVERIAQRRVLDAVQAQTAHRNKIKIAGPWVLNLDGSWVRFRAGVGDVVTRVYKQSAIREWFIENGGMAPNARVAREQEDARLASEGWMLE